MNSFYNQPKLIQWIVAIFMLVILLIILGLWLEFTYRNPLIYLLLFLWVPIFQFLATPIFTLSGWYKYLSPMLLVYAPNEKKYDIHNGTSFDYLMVMRGVKRGAELRKKLLGYYIAGLLCIIEEIEQGKLPKDLVIRGSSYFFSQSTANRLGFKTSETGIAERMNIVINYLDLLWMYSLSWGKLAFPSIKATKTAEITAADLLKSKGKLQELQVRLS